MPEGDKLRLKLRLYSNGKKEERRKEGRDGGREEGRGQRKKRREGGEIRGREFSNLCLRIHVYQERYTELGVLTCI